MKKTLELKRISQRELSYWSERAYQQSFSFEGTVCVLGMWSCSFAISDEWQCRRM